MTGNTGCTLTSIICSPPLLGTKYSGMDQVKICGRQSLNNLLIPLLNTLSHLLHCPPLVFFVVFCLSFQRVQMWNIGYIWNGSKLLMEHMIDSVFHPSEVWKMDTKNFLGLVATVCSINPLKWTVKVFYLINFFYIKPVNLSRIWLFSRFFLIFFFFMGSWFFGSNGLTRDKF